MKVKLEANSGELAIDRCGFNAFKQSFYRLYRFLSTRVRFHTVDADGVVGRHND
ncbi:hypothetical protein [uncultured Roseibium sp.]|uniref:hypothetical protein n=1 Tax=uncultured Roseibium sp. TaxID=1936171 RepID=UPI0026145196|nr:hypothetical protein [uncultured Roseibium sp.]